MTVAVAHQSSPTGTVALQHGAREASLRSTNLVVLNVVESLDLDSEEALRRGLSEHIQQVLDTAGHTGLTWELRLSAEDENVAEAIVEEARKLDAELLVIGARRRSPLGKFLLGSATQSIILDAPMPVLVVKPDA
jgi:nucleotide-binding universal stress UspA family protein